MLTVACWSLIQVFGLNRTSADAHSISFSNYQTGNSPTLTSPSYSNDLRQWHFWTLTFNPSTSTRVLYRDAVAVASDSPTLAQAFNALATIYIGYNGLTGTNGIYVNAMFDEFRIYCGTALTSSQVLAGLYNVFPTGAKFYASGSAQTGTTLTDNSGSGNSFTITTLSTADNVWATKPAVCFCASRTCC